LISYVRKWALADLRLIPDANVGLWWEADIRSPDFRSRSLAVRPLGLSSNDGTYGANDAQLTHCFVAQGKVPE
jgi:hypothetical protein